MLNPVVFESALPYTRSLVVLRVTVSDGVILVVLKTTADAVMGEGLCGGQSNC